MHAKRPGAFGAQLISWVTVLALSLGAVNARQLVGLRRRRTPKSSQTSPMTPFWRTFHIARSSFSGMPATRTRSSRESICTGTVSPYPLEKRDVGSTGATGFGITALCIAADRVWVPREKARQRALNTVQYYAERAPNEHGWF